MAWDGKVGIDLPYHAGATYNVELNGDLKNVSSHLPSPLAKPAGEPLPVNVKVDGNLNSFDLTGQAGADNHFNSRWLLGQSSRSTVLFGRQTVKRSRRCRNKVVLNSICRR